MVAFLTFGLITPTHEIWEAFDHNPSNRASIGPEPRTSTAVAAEHDDYQDEQIQIQEEEIDYNALLLDAAREQSYIKFGTKVGPKISNEFDSIIFPKMEEAIAMTVANLGDQSAASLTISEKPSGHYGEKIFNVINNETGADVIRFHVRTEKDHRKATTITSTITVPRTNSWYTTTLAISIGKKHTTEVVVIKDVKHSFTMRVFFYLETLIYQRL